MGIGSALWSWRRRLGHPAVWRIRVHSCVQHGEHGGNRPLSGLYCVFLPQPIGRRGGFSKDCRMDPLGHADLGQDKPPIAAWPPVHQQL